jgi:hypothetical protein
MGKKNSIPIIHKEVWCSVIRNQYQYERGVVDEYKLMRSAGCISSWKDSVLIRTVRQHTYRSHVIDIKQEENEGEENFHGELYEMV